MPQTRDLGRLFAHPIKLKPGTKRVHRAQTNELDEPYRQSNSLVIRFGRTKGIVLGRWHHTERTADEALRDALQSDLEDPYQLDEAEESIANFYRPPLPQEQAQAVLEAARTRVAKGSKDLNDEALILDMLGLW
jgi:Icc-related predicted phosphoesterase